MSKSLSEAPSAAAASKRSSSRSTLGHRKEDKRAGPIAFSDDRIQKVNFIETQGVTVPSVFKGAVSWEDVPKFAVITGRNGSGKTRMFDFLNQCLSQTMRDKYTYIKASFDFNVSEIEVGMSYGQVPWGSPFQLEKTSKILEEIFVDEDKISEYKIRPEHAESFQNRLFKKIKEDKESGRLKKDEITAVKIKEMAYSMFQYDKNKLKLENPLEFLKYVIQQYHARRMKVFEQSKDIGNAITLFEYYEELSEEQLREMFKQSPKVESYIGLDLKGFLNQLKDSQHFRDCLTTYYVRTILPLDPLEELNQILSKYKFKYKLAFGPLHRMASSLIFKKEGKEISYNELSDGERMILSMMAWLYHAQGFSVSGEGVDRRFDGKTKIIMLDEPDKHLDPKLCKLFYRIINEEIVKKQGIQVIMSSHRIDTVALAPPESLYCIGDDAGYTKVQKVHKLQAMFQMSSNLRELVDYHHKVYTESRDDAWFYEGVYRSLVEICNGIREEKRQGGSRDYYWKSEDKALTPRRLLSERYQMSFYSVSEKEILDGKVQTKSKGGCSVVKSSISKDLTAHGHLHHVSAGGASGFSWFKKGKILDHPKFYRSYGVIDSDYGATDAEHNKVDLAEHIEILPRHSLDNYLLDPIIMCASLKEDEIREYISNSRGHFYREGGKNGKALLINACLEIKKALKGESYDALQAHVEKYFRIILYVMNGSHDRSSHKRKGEAAKVYRSIKAKVVKGSRMQLCDKPIAFIMDAGKTFTLQYPKEFQEVRGHDIEEFFFNLGGKKKNPFDATGTIASRIYHQGLPFIPLDLADVFFNLNQKIRRNVRSVIKPEAHDPGPVEEKKAAVSSSSSSSSSSSRVSLGLSSYGRSPFKASASKGAGSSEGDQDEDERGREHDKVMDGARDGDIETDLEALSRRQGQRDAAVSGSAAAALAIDSPSLTDSAALTVDESSTSVGSGPGGVSPPFG